MLKHLKWILLVPVIALGAMWVFIFVQKPQTSVPGLAPIAPVPHFEFRNQAGEPFSDQNLLGKVTLVNFIFTHCPTVCPLLTERMKTISQAMTQSEVQFVSISVDPENDSPEQLKKYAERFGADLSRWSFLTGPLEEISKTIISGFKISLIRDKKKNKNKKAAPEDLFDITHGEHFVLVDTKGMIRGYQMVQTEEDQTLLMAKLQQLLTEKND